MTGVLPRSPRQRARSSPGLRRLAASPTRSCFVGRSHESAGSMSLSPKPGVMEIDAYVPGRSEAPGAGRVYKLSSNESPFGPSPKAIAAYEAAEPALGLYPEGSARILRNAIAAHYGLAPDRIVCGNGSDEILTLLANSYVRPRDEVLFSAHSFSLYKIVTLANSGVPVE